MVAKGKINYSRIALIRCWFIQHNQTKLKIVGLNKYVIVSQQYIKKEHFTLSNLEVSICRKSPSK